MQQLTLLTLAVVGALVATPLVTSLVGATETMTIDSNKNIVIHDSANDTQSPPAPRPSRSPGKTKKKHPPIKTARSSPLLRSER